MRNMTSDEMIAKYREALAFYADPQNWAGGLMNSHLDMNRDDCSGLYCKFGEVARQALLYNENMTINEDTRG